MRLRSSLIKMRDHFRHIFITEKSENAVQAERCINNTPVSKIDFQNFVPTISTLKMRYVEDIDRSKPTNNDSRLLGDCEIPLLMIMRNDLVFHCREKNELNLSFEALY